MSSPPPASALSRFLSGVSTAVFGPTIDPEQRHKEQLKRIQKEIRQLQRQRDNDEDDYADEWKKLVSYQADAGRKDEARLMATQMIHRREYIKTNLANEQQLTHLEAQLKQCKTQTAFERVLIDAVRALHHWTSQVTPQRMEEVVVVYNIDRLQMQIKQEKTSTALKGQSHLADNVTAALAETPPTSVQELLDQAYDACELKRAEEEATRAQINQLKARRQERQKQRVLVEAIVQPVDEEEESDLNAIESALEDVELRMRFERMMR